MNQTTVLRWESNERQLLPAVGGDLDVLLAADSWLVADGFVRGLEYHRQRFFTACTESADICAEDLHFFWRHVVAALPRSGQWFPRVELARVDDSVKLQLRVRQAPPQTRAVRLLRWPATDPRTLPLRKGPDLALLASMRQQAISQGADEALLLTADGVVLEGLTTSVIWWESGALCLPDPSLDVLPGVTSRLLVELAEADDIPVIYKHLHVEELSGRTVWTCNALHGIRPVIQWIDSPWIASCHIDHVPFQSSLNGLGVHLDGISH